MSGRPGYICEDPGYAGYPHLVISLEKYMPNSIIERGNITVVTDKYGRPVLSLQLVYNCIRNVSNDRKEVR